MGNHIAGYAIADTAVALGAVRARTGLTAREILDIVTALPATCRSAVMTPTPIRFGKLVTEAFAPEGAAPEGLDLKTDEGYDWWDEHCWLPFRLPLPVLMVAVIR